MKVIRKTINSESNYVVASQKRVTKIVNNSYLPKDDIPEHITIDNVEKYANELISLYQEKKRNLHREKECWSTDFSNNEVKEFLDFTVRFYSKEKTDKLAEAILENLEIFREEKENTHRRMEAYAKLLGVVNSTIQNTVNTLYGIYGKPYFRYDNIEKSDLYDSAVMRLAKLFENIKFPAPASGETANNTIVAYFMGCSSLTVSSHIKREIETENGLSKYYTMLLIYMRRAGSTLDDSDEDIYDCTSAYVERNKLYYTVSMKTIQELKRIYHFRQNQTYGSDVYQKPDPVSTEGFSAIDFEEIRNKCDRHTQMLFDIYEEYYVNRGETKKMPVDDIRREMWKRGAKLSADAVESLQTTLADVTQRNLQKKSGVINLDAVSYDSELFIAV